MKKIYTLILIGLLSLSILAQQHKAIVQKSSARLSKTQGQNYKSYKAKINTASTKAPGDILYNFDFTNGLPTDWTIVDSAGIGGWQIHSGLVDPAQYVTPATYTINSTSGGNYLYMPVELYNTVPGSSPPVDSSILYNCNAVVITNWMDVSSTDFITLSYETWFRSWYGELSIYVYIDGDEINPAAILNGHHINGEIIENSYPGPFSSNPTQGDGNNMANPKYNLTAAVGHTFNSVKIAFRAHSTSHYIWSIDDVKITETEGSDLSILEVYASENILTTSQNNYQDFNYNYSEVPVNIQSYIQLGALVHQDGVNAENTHILFELDSGTYQNTTWSSTSSIIPNYLGLSADTILRTDTSNNYTNSLYFYNPEFNFSLYPQNEILTSGIPYIFKYSVLSDNTDENINDNFAFYEFAQTQGRYSYHWQPDYYNGVNIYNSHGPFSYQTATPTNGDILANRFDFYQETGNEFKIYGLRFYLPSLDFENVTFDESGNGVTVSPVLFYWDENANSGNGNWVEITEVTGAESPYGGEFFTIHEWYASHYVYLNFNSTEVEAFDFPQGEYLTGIRIENYNNQKICIGVDQTYRQGNAHSLMKIAPWQDTWQYFESNGSVMIDVFTNTQQIINSEERNYDNIKPKKSPIKFILYPNPTKDYITLEYQDYNNSPLEASTIYIILGQVIKYFILHSSSTKVSTESWKSGIYFVKVGSDIQKLIVI